MDLELIRTMALPYWARPGIVTATDPEDGGDDDEPDDDDDDLDDDDDDDEDADKTDDELRAELKEVRKSLAKANGSSKSKRLKMRKLQEELDSARRQPSKKSKSKDDEDDAPDVDAIREQARQEARAESDNRVKRASVRSELRAAGIPTESAGRLVGLVKLEDLDVDDDGNVDGLDEVLDELRADFPQLFGKGEDEPKRTTRRSVAGREGTPTGRSKKLSTDEAQAAALVRR